MNRRQLAAYLVICAVWGSTWAAIRIVVMQVPPMEVAAIRFILAGLIMLPFVYFRRMVFPRGRALKVSLILGVVMIGVQYALVFCAERYISSGITAVLYSCSPLVVGIITPRILGKPVPRAALTAMLVGVGGLFIVLRSIVSTSPSQIIPALVMLLAMVVSSVCSVYASRELREVSVFAAGAVQFICGGILLAILSAVFERGQTAAWTPSALGALLFLIFGGSITAFSLYYWLLQTVEPFRVVTVQFVIPLVAVTEGSVFLKETFPFLELCGALIVLSAVILVLRIPADDDRYLDVMME
jgi:drug/metabolite transporter (DMT)-like permease